jgi:hypothetical protein
MYWGRKDEFTTYENVISVVYNGVIAAGKVYAHKEKTGILAESYFIKLRNHEASHNQNIFLAALLEKTLYYKYSRDYLATWDNKVENDKILLPIKDNSIDYDFMESFIAELESRPIAELESYLSVTGLKDTNLSLEEEKALLNFDKIKWQSYRIGDSFAKVQTKKMPYKANDLPKEATGKYLLPCLTSSFNNQGLNYFVPEEGATILKDVISIPSNSDVYRAYYQSRKFTVLSDAYAIHWRSENINLTSRQYLFFVSSINKVTDLKIYSYKNKLGGWNVVKNKYLKVPVKNNEIDFDYMDTLISAIQKLFIKNVVTYSDKKISATKSVEKKH